MSKKSKATWWFDLDPRRMTRRDMLRLSGDVGLLISMGALSSIGTSGRGPRLRNDPFAFGVASGDPTADSVVLWTRLDRGALEEAGTARERVPVRWELARDDAFQDIIGQGSAGALPELGHAVHVEVDALQPARWYWYRFMVGDAVSPVGRTRTAPSPDQPGDRLRFAFASCQNYEHGYFTALRHLSEENADLVLHLGDYIYEKRFGADENMIRSHEGGEDRA